MSIKLNCVDLFSGIGGFSYALEKYGVETCCFVEIDKDCRKVIKKHWPNKVILDDVNKVSGKDLMKRFGEIDIICGGFPCTDISIAGGRKGFYDLKKYKKLVLKGVNKDEAKKAARTRSGLWKEYARIIKETKPKIVIIENVENLRKKGLGVVLNDLYRIGYDAEWHCFTADAFNLPHQRRRLYIIAYARGIRLHKRSWEKRQIQINKERENQETYTEREKRIFESFKICPIFSRGQVEDFRNSRTNKRAAVLKLRRVTNGIPQGLHESDRKRRIKQLGNSIVPDIAEFLISRIINILS